MATYFVSNLNQKGLYANFRRCLNMARVCYVRNVTQIPPKKSPRQKIIGKG
jgi:hypothetical protein